MDYNSIPVRFGEDGAHVTLSEVNARQLLSDITKGTPVKLGSGKQALWVDPVTVGTAAATDIGRDASFK